MLTWLIVNNVFPEDYVVYTVPSKVHLQPVFMSLIRMFRSNSFLKNFIEPNKGINSSDNTISLKNGAKLICRIAGQSGTGANVIGLHTPFIILDEAGYYPWGTWLELQPTMNNWTAGSRLITSGVPTGMREKNVLYHTDQVDTGYTKHRITAYDNPRFSEDDEVAAVEQYGGKESDDFMHFILGKHGTPVFAVFDRRLMHITPYGVERLKIDGIKSGADLTQYTLKLNLLPSLPSEAGGRCIMGIDLGYTEPTAIVVLYQLSSGVFKFLTRVQLTKVSYDVQERIIDYLDSKYSPMIIGIDEGSAGKSTVHHLLNDKTYLGKNYAKRLIPINFASTVSLGKDLDGNEIMAKMKPLSVSVLQEYTNNHRINYSTTDLDMVTELERMTYTKNPSGDIVYRTLTPRGGQKGEDHFTAALLCGMFAYHQNFEMSLINPKKKLATSRWFGK